MVLVYIFVGKVVEHQPADRLSQLVTLWATIQWVKVKLDCRHYVLLGLGVVPPLSILMLRMSFSSRLIVIMNQQQYLGDSDDFFFRDEAFWTVCLSTH